LDRNLILLGGLIIVAAASAAIWHFFAKSYAWAIVGSSATVGVITYFAYPILRGVVPNALIVMNAFVLGVVIALGVGIPFKRGRFRKSGVSNDV
jgi:hypothetical protein